MLGRKTLVLLALAAVVVLVALVFGVRWIIGRIHRGETQPAATEVAQQAQTPSPTPTEWGAEKFPTSTPMPTVTPNPTATPVKIGVDAFGLPEGYQPEGAVAEEIPDLKKLAPMAQETPATTVPGGLDVVQKVLEKGKEIKEGVEQIRAPAATPIPAPTAEPVRVCRFWKFGCKDVTPTPTPTPTPLPGWAKDLLDKAGDKAAEVWQAIAGPTPTPTPPPKKGIAGTGIPVWPVAIVVVVVLIIVAFRAGFIGIERIEPES